MRHQTPSNLFWLNLPPLSHLRYPGGAFTANEAPAANEGGGRGIRWRFALTPCESGIAPGLENRRHFCAATMLWGDGLWPRAFSMPGRAGAPRGAAGHPASHQPGHSPTRKAIGKGTSGEALRPSPSGSPQPLCWRPVKGRGRVLAELEG